MGKRWEMGTMGTADRVTVDHILTCDVGACVSAIGSMSADDCEHNARAILDRIGGPTFEQYVMRIVETMIPEDGNSPPKDCDDYYLAVRELFPHISTEDDILGRLAALVMKMFALRMEGKSLHTTAKDTML